MKTYEIDSNICMHYLQENVWLHKRLFGSTYIHGFILGGEMNRVLGALGVEVADGSVVESRGWKWGQVSLLQKFLEETVT